MPVVKLTLEHKDAVKNLFKTPKYMGSEIAKTPDFNVKGANINAETDQAELFNTVLYNIFVSNYLSDLTKNFHAYGYVDEEDGEVKALISFYESTEEPAWYYTVYRSSGNNGLLREVLDEVIKYNESNGRLKFYTLVAQKHSKLLRRFHWSAENDERYGYFDEYVVPAKTKCFYVNAWELLYKRFLLPDNSVVRCNYLKQEYRTRPVIGGNI